MTKVLVGKVALITGGSRGLGAATARLFAEQGADVAFTYLNSESEAKAVAAEVEATGQRVLAIKSDQGDIGQAPVLVAKVVEHFGRLDVLVNNAGVGWQNGGIDSEQFDPAKMDQLWNINIHGPVATIRAAVKHLPQGGRIISIGSGIATRTGWPGSADYAATKAALVGYSKGAARDLGPRGITVNVVQAGLMDTPATEAAAHAFPKSILEAHALARRGTTDEIASAVVYLASPAASYITGAVLDVSGGYLA